LLLFEVIGSPRGSISVYNGSSGTTDFVVDCSGYFT
jgi:hypothetical protein